MYGFPSSFRELGAPTETDQRWRCRTDPCSDHERSRRPVTFVVIGTFNFTGMRIRLISALTMALCAVFAVGAAAQDDGAASDRAALGALYDATGGAGWLRHDNWKTSAPLGTWYGVSTDAAGRVQILWLPDNGLSGPIPAALENLSNLTHLHLSENALTGPIPAALGNLSNLRELNLRSNNLSGAIPDALGDLYNLTHIYLDRERVDRSDPRRTGQALQALMVVSLFQ